MITAYQIEVEQAAQPVGQQPTLARIEATFPASSGWRRPTWGRGRVLGISADDLVKLQEAWGSALWPNLLQVGRARKDMAIRLLAAHSLDYRRATAGWWSTISQEIDRYLRADLFYRPVYFVSSTRTAWPTWWAGMQRRSNQSWSPFSRKPTRRTCGAIINACRGQPGRVS